MPRGKRLTSADEFTILDGIHSRIPTEYLAGFLGVSAKTVRERAEELEGTEKQKVYLTYQAAHAEYDQQHFDFMFEDSRIIPNLPDDSTTGIDKVMETFDLTRKAISEIETEIAKLARKCVLEYRHLRKLA